MVKTERLMVGVISSQAVPVSMANMMKEYGNYKPH